MCAEFQRISSAVEGCNGYLSRLHHANRGFTEQSLKVLKTIHNFDLKRDDGTTAAQRLFDKPFPDLFEWVVLNMGDLPRARRTLKPKMPKKPSIQFVVAFGGGTNRRRNSSLIIRMLSRASAKLAVDVYHVVLCM
jgi:hypothetical protein